MKTLPVKLKSRLTIDLDVWGTGCIEPRGVAYHKRQYARACALLAQEGSIRLTYLGVADDNRWLSEEGLRQYGSFRTFRIPGRLQQFAARFSFLPWYWLVGNPDIYHSFTLYPFKSGHMRLIGTLFDFVPLRVPEFSSLSQAAEQIRWCSWASRQPGARWIVNSEHTRKDAIAIARLYSDQVQVVNLCADEIFFKPPVPAKVESTLADLGIKQPYFLCVNTLNPRKNHLRLLEAWQEGDFAKHGWTLVLVGHAASNSLVERLQAGEFVGVIWLGYVPRIQQVELYYGCEAVLYPSLYEGFGMPVAEAIACGKALLVSHRSPMADIAGEGAVLVDPLDVTSIQSGLKALAFNPQLREKLGLENHARRDVFTIQRMAQDLLVAYQNARL